MTHYEAVYGQQPPFMVSYLPNTSKINDVDSLLQNQEAALTTFKGNFDNDSKSHETTSRSTSL